METDLLLLDLPFIVYTNKEPLQSEEVSSPSVSKSAVQLDPLNALQHTASMDAISQYYVFPNNHDQQDFIVYDTPEENPHLDPKLQLSGMCSPLQTIFLVRALEKPIYLGARVPVPTHWDLSLLETLLADYEDKLVVDFLRYGWPMSWNILPLTSSSAKVNRKGALDFPDAINQYLATEHANNTLLGPFFTNPFPDRSASSPLNSVPKHDSDEHQVILDMSFPPGHSVNDRIDKDHYLGVLIDLTYPTIDSFTTMVKAVGPGDLMYKRDLCRAYHQIWTDPFDVLYQGFFWQQAFYFDTVLVMGCTSSAYICQQVTSALVYIHNSWGALCTNYLDDFIGVAPPKRAEKDFHKLGWLLQDIGVWESQHKACPPSLIMIVLGILFNTINMTISISPERVDDIQAELQALCNRTKMSHKQLESLIAKLQFASQVIRAGCVFLAHLLDELQGSPKRGYVSVPAHIVQDLRWWQYIMPILNGTKSI